MNGVTRNPKKGFCFNREANYNGTIMRENFFSKMFTKEYGNDEKLKSIKKDENL